MTTKQQGIRFLMVGAFAALIHFCGLIAGVQFFKIDPAYANVLAFCLAFIFSFLGHRYVTFHQHGQEVWWLALIKWFMSSIFGFLCNQLLFVYGLSYFGNDFYVWIWIVVTLVVTIFTFLLAKFWAFKKSVS